MTSAQQHRRASIPPIPDLRFETAYLSKIRPFVHFEQVPALREASDDFENDDVLYGNEGEQPARDVLEIDWKNVFWVTFRDQVLTMWVQGPSSAFTYGQYTPKLGRDLSAKRAEPCHG
ncbi:uncharacterized protein BT62DRAFT_1003446 [Guyanagaster necrorhizus]|uniref:Uncharacterized protein n=1 Tax=Guyanagaster necrorhizus TaxID=856835 RepID=A0A9P7VWC5_9AGAR|nr:uncharacterized protein BT62DRAFT_1003446 [Guyanagaster necrorhizus MCA 3950]KAG7448741.1 hypothetical protein BT62DRAFT_1003446 [Guyanagaster necrorhizus MCA 3950]